MSKAKVPLFKAPLKFATVETDATIGATVGVNLFWPDGTVVVEADFNPTPEDTGNVGGISRTMWSLVLEIPANVTALENATGAGLFAVTGAGTGAFRTITAVAGETTVANGDGVAGNPTVGLADVTATAGGTLQKYGFDGKGRRSQEEATTTDDLGEGTTNLYFTDERAQAAVVVQTIDDGDTTHAPSGDAVFAALAAVLPLSSGTVAFTDAINSGPYPIERPSTGDTSGTTRTVITGYQSNQRTLQILGSVQGGTGKPNLYFRTSHSTLGGGGWTAEYEVAPLDSPVFIGPVSMVLGAGNGLTLQNNTTDATTKDARILIGHYTNAEESITAFGGASFDPSAYVAGDISGNVNAGNVARFGGGFGVQNAMNSLRFYTAPSPTTTGGTLRWAIDDAGHFRVGANNTYDIGTAAAAPRDIYTVNAVTVTSDAREKSNIRTLNAQELSAGLELATAARIYQWNGAIAEKGDAARLHCSPTVQSVIAIMQSHGLDPFRYGFVCYDEWGEMPEQRDPETGEVMQEYRPAGDRYSLRPDELAAFRDAALAQNQASLDARLKALEG